MAKQEKKEKEYVETPLMKQYYEAKAKYPDALLLFRVGDFYETFGQDAVKASEILGITLTRRANGSASYVELAGFPHHSVDTYLPKLVKAGQRVAICEQLEDPKLTKKIVKRGITELVTPGVSYNDKVLEHKENNFLAGLHFGEKESGVSFLDVSTGEFYVAQGTNEYIDKLLQSFRPSEIILQKSKVHKFIEVFGEKFYTNTFEDWVFTIDFGEELLQKHFHTSSLKGFGIEDLKTGIIAAGAALHYLSETQHNNTQHISKISRIVEDHYVWLDKFTIRNLELLYSPHEQAVTLLDVMDKTVSPMGARMLKRWIALPLKDEQPINERLDVVGFLMSESEFSENLRKEILQIGDLERLIAKVAVSRINPREVGQLKKALFAIEEIKNQCATSNNIALQKIAEQLNTCEIIRTKIDNELHAEAPVMLNKGNVMAEGVNAELDDLRNLSRSGKDYLVGIQQREIERTGISSLKVGFNNVFGYYLEVTNAHKDKVPQEWMRKQTLTNGERYITEELKEYEQKILTAEDKILALETKLFNDLLLAILDYIQPVQRNAELIARIDCLLSFANISKENRYVRPEINNSLALNIKKGRHPVIEKHLPLGQAYIPNDVFLDDETQQMIIITGPNMSGKSALLRQTALIVLMAQMGCYVPAEAAQIGLVDRVFTRVGASDNISSGESTFMVEMNETASILNNISERSLILLDEIGRGTATYDGISIAWAIAEYLHEYPDAKPKVLFATHYHELNDLATDMPRIKNYHVAVKEIGNKVIFLRELRPGGSEHSFGIHVARMAGMPDAVLQRAGEMLTQLEESHGGTTGRDAMHCVSTEKSKQKPEMQLSFIQLDDPLLEEIKHDILKTDVNTLTPVEALMKLNSIKQLLSKK